MPSTAASMSSDSVGGAEPVARSSVTASSSR